MIRIAAQTNHEYRFSLEYAAITVLREFGEEINVQNHAKCILTEVFL